MNGIKIEDGVIVEATENALHRYWLTRWSDFYSWEEYKKLVQQNGCKIVKGDNNESE